MYDIDQMLENIRANEEIAKRLFEIELKILSIDNFGALFEELLLLIEEKFQIPHVWISLVEHSDLSNLLIALKSSDLLQSRLKMVSKKDLLNLFGRGRTPVLANEDLRPFFKFFPDVRKFQIRSLAIAPVTLDGNVIGSLNMGDSSRSRFQPDMDTFFLSQLVVKISICLANVSAREQLRQLATRDPLTNLLNRREMEFVLEQEFHRARRYSLPLALVFIDCDDFKGVNDEYGHDCGDALLCYLASELRKIVRMSDLIFRFAGDEFVVVLPNHTSEGAAWVSKRLRIFFQERPMKYGKKLVPVSISCGVASTMDQGIKDAASLLKAADESLYENKRQREAFR